MNNYHWSPLVLSYQLAFTGTVLHFTPWIFNTLPAICSLVIIKLAFVTCRIMWYLNIFESISWEDKQNSYTMLFGCLVKIRFPTLMVNLINISNIKLRSLQCIIHWGPCMQHLLFPLVLLQCGNLTVPAWLCHPVLLLLLLHLLHQTHLTTVNRETVSANTHLSLSLNEMTLKKR